MVGKIEQGRAIVAVPRHLLGIPNGTFADGFYLANTWAKSFGGRNQAPFERQQDNAPDVERGQPFFFGSTEKAPKAGGVLKARAGNVKSVQGEDTPGPTVILSMLAAILVATVLPRRSRRYR